MKEIYSRKKMNILISIIIPVFNVEEYLDRCVKSIILQTYTNLEIILVDDGSPDRCPEMCDEWEKRDERVRVIHKENGGLSDARNAGIDVAKGKYIAFVDSDDWIDCRCIEVLYNVLDKNNAQIAVCGMKKTATTNIKKRYGLRKEIIYNQKEALGALLYQKPFDTSACGKLYDISLFYKVRFPQGILFEDLATIYKLFSKAERTIYCSEKLYFYFQNQRSITHEGFSKKRLSILATVDDLYEYIVVKYPELEKAAISRKFSVYSYIVQQLPNANEWDDQRERLWSYIKYSRKIILIDYKTRKKNKVAALLSIFGCNMYRKINKVIIG